MNLDLIVVELKEQRRRIDRAITALEALKRGSASKRTREVATRKRQTGRGVSPAQSRLQERAKAEDGVRARNARILPFTRSSRRINQSIQEDSA